MPYKSMMGFLKATDTGACNAYGAMPYALQVMSCTGAFFCHKDAGYNAEVILCPISQSCVELPIVSLQGFHYLPDGQ